MSIRPTTSLCPSANKAATFQGLSFSEILVCKNTTEKTTESYAALMQEWKSLLPKDHVVFPRPSFPSLPSEIIFNVFSFTGDARNFSRLGATCTQLFKWSINKPLLQLFYDRLRCNLAQLKSDEETRLITSAAKREEAFNAHSLADELYNEGTISEAEYNIAFLHLEDMEEADNELYVTSTCTILAFQREINNIPLILCDPSVLERKNRILKPIPTQTKSDS